MKDISPTVTQDLNFDMPWAPEIFFNIERVIAEIRLRLAAARGKDVFGVAVRLLAALEDEVAGGLEGDAVEGGCHWLVDGIARVLFVDDDGHALERFHDLRLGDHTLV